MIIAHIDWIESSEFDSWEEFEQFEPTDPFDHFSWFTVCVSEKGKEGGSNFQVVVSTPKAIARAKKQNEKFKGLVIDRFSSAEAKKAIETKVNEETYYSYQDIVDTLSTDMLWEYENHTIRR